MITARLTKTKENMGNTKTLSPSLLSLVSDDVVVVVVVVVDVGVDVVDVVVGGGVYSNVVIVPGHAAFE